MKDYQNPVEILNLIYKQKYKMLALPIAIIVINFVIKIMIEVNIVRYISGLAFIAFVLIHYVFRVNRPLIEINESNLLAPVNGKIREISKHDNFYQLVIDKSFLSSSEIRSMTNLDKYDLDENTPSFQIKGVWSKCFTEKNPHPQGQLIGIAPGRAIAIVNIPLSYELSVQDHNYINAGITILATSKNASSISSIGRDDE